MAGMLLRLSLLQLPQMDILAMFVGSAGKRGHLICIRLTVNAIIVYFVKEY